MKITIEANQFLSIPGKTNAPLVLLLTRDRGLAGTFVEVLAPTGGSILVVQNLDDTLKTICSRKREINFAVVDFDDGCHRMTMLSAISSICEELPIIAVTNEDFEHAAALAYANGATACLVKPFTAATVADAIRSAAEQPNNRHFSPN
jgi:DNA-binding NtrC family response regulator